MNRWFSLIIVAVAALVTTKSVDAADESADVKAKIESTLGWEVTAVADAPVEGLMQVTTEQGLFYVSDDAKYLLQARIFNIDEGMRNETEVALSSMRNKGVAELASSAVEFKADEEKHVITVFTDITCGYCRKLHDQIEQYNDLGITVRYLAFPRAGLNTQSYRDMVSVWCAKDPQQALTQAKAGEAIKAANCENDIAEQYQFGQRIGVTGTPNIIFPDGTLIPGYQPAATIAQALKQVNG